MCVFLTSTTASVNWLPTIGLHTMPKNNRIPSIFTKVSKGFSREVWIKCHKCQWSKSTRQIIVAFGGICSLSWLSVSPQDLSHIWRRYSACFSLKAAFTAWGDRTLTKATCLFTANGMKECGAKDANNSNNHQMKWHYDAMMFIWLCTPWWQVLGKKPNCLREPPWRWNAESTALCMNDVVIVFICFASRTICATKQCLPLLQVFP